MIRVAAVGDLHVGLDSRGSIRPDLDGLADEADVLLIAGDLTQHGSAAEAEVLIDELRDLGLPILTVLGNHDYHSGCEGELRGLLERAGIRVLEAENEVLEVNGCRLGVAGVKGFGGGYVGACASEFGEPEMKAFIQHTKRAAERFGASLAAMSCDVRLALTHYSPVKGTLRGERLEIYPFLGSYLLGEVIDEAGCQLALHGHAHRGVERGVTSGGVPVRNVARPVIRLAYKTYELSEVALPDATTSPDDEREVHSIT